MLELGRNWGFIAYVEELGGFDIFLSKLKDLHYGFVCSPIHSPSDKKKHCHVILKGEKKSKNQIISLLEKITEKKDDSLIGIATPQIINNLRGSVRYLLHLDDLDKEQFAEKKLYSYDFDYEKFLKNKDDLKNDLKSLIKVIRECGFTKILDLIEYCFDNDIDINYIEKHTYLIVQLLKENQKNIKNVVDILEHLD